MRAQRQDQAACSLTVDGRKIPIIFSTREGGMTDSEESKSRPGAMGAQRANGGPASVENVSLSGEFIPQIHDGDVRYLRSRCGNGEAVAVEQYLDRDGNAFGRPQTWTGILKSCHPGNYDADSSDPRLVEVEVSTDGVVG